MQPGELRHRITFQRRGIDPETGGLMDWTDYASVWAKIEDLSGRDYIQSQQLAEGSRVSTRITIRWRGDIDPAMRIRHGGRIFSIQAILDPDGMRRQLQIMCSRLE